MTMAPRGLVTRGQVVGLPADFVAASDLCMKEATEFLEKSLREDCERGQLTRGSSEWASPAFPTREDLSHKAIKRKRRVVIDYRELNKRTVRKRFLVLNSDEI